MAAKTPTVIAVRGASEHNLKALDVDVPRGALTVITGVSGSGKSSLAYDTIHREGQRRYLESFSSHARQLLGRVGRPAVAAVDGLSPTIAVDQHGLARTARSTVGTATGLWDLLRLLYARLGELPAGIERGQVERSLFSFNSAVGACPHCQGLGVEDRLDPELLVADPSKTLRNGALRLTTPMGYLMYSQVTMDVLDQVCQAHGFSVDIPWQDLTAEQRRIVLEGSDIIRIPYGKHPLSSRLRWQGITPRPRQEGTYKGILPVMEGILRSKRTPSILRFVRSLSCSACAGSRLRPEALAITFRGRSIAALGALAADELDRFFGALELAAEEAPVAAPIRAELCARCQVLAELGLGHLALARPTVTLSSGEAQRLRIATQIGVGLAGLIYVFDEPSIGVHPRDTERLLDVLSRVRDAGNTVLVVEHDRTAIARADWLIDIGPGAGRGGGELLFAGEPAALLAEDAAGLERSRTRACLLGIESAPVPARRRLGNGCLGIGHARRNNLKGIDVEIPLGVLTAITGVSGAGKSSLVAELCAQRADGRLGGADLVDSVIAIDQSPIGRTPRSNPATYTGLADRIRDLFAALPEARKRGFDKGRFSFNVKGGRCEACEGAGVIEVGMHFLGSVDVVCESCGGRRFGAETLAVHWRGRSIADLYALPVAEALELCADQPRLHRYLATLADLGLGYLALGQPSIELSGGEAQRIKLATELARTPRGHVLYILDEPTTGLHPSDVALLLASLERLVDAGHTVLVVEHDLDVIARADHVIDLGPEGGAGGGEVVASGTPEQVAAEPRSHTGAALREVLAGRRLIGGLPAGGRAAASEPRRIADIELRGVRTHNLQGIDVTIPGGSLTVITGVSGSGKSSLAFDTIAVEGHNRFAESLSAYVRRRVIAHGESDVDSCVGLTPTIAIAQRTASRNPRSTVGTMTEIADCYRLLFARAGVRHCPACAAELDGGRCPACGHAGAEVLLASMLSPNGEAGACSGCRGLGFVLRCDPDVLVSHPERSLVAGAMAGHKAGRYFGEPDGQHVAALRAAGGAIGIDYEQPWSALDEAARTVAMRGLPGRQLEVEWRYRRGARTGVHRFATEWQGFARLVEQEHERTHLDARGEALESLLVRVVCPECAGARLNREALAVRFAGVNIAELSARTVDASLELLAAVERDPGAAGVSPIAFAISAPVRDEVRRRLERLRAAGLGYLEVDRAAATLSGGEAQRVRLAGLLTGGLCGITYVLDEPTAGLHPRDTERLLGLLDELRNAGNTVVVVEHDPDVMRAADHIVDLGPGAGTHGGQVVASGPPAAIAGEPASLTGRYLRDREHTRPRAPRRALRPGLTVRGATSHNLRGLDVEIPAGGLVALTGVSGSGKSTLLLDVVAPSLARLPVARPVACRELILHEPFGALRLVEQGLPAGSSASLVATVAGVLDPLRALYAATPAARERRLAAGAFTPFGKGGACDACGGEGRTRVSMDFLPDVFVLCEVCNGRRFGAEVLACLIDGRSIADVLESTVEDASAVFARHPRIAAPLALLADVGLGYLRLGQRSAELSGGERQRLRLAGELRESSTPSLFLLDEPTAGLHCDDVARLLGVLDRLIAAGHTVAVVEHNLDVIRHADWVIDLGPEGGDAGGRVVAVGAPEQIAGTAGSWTGLALRAGDRAQGTGERGQRREKRGKGRAELPGRSS